MVFPTFKGIEPKEDMAEMFKFNFARKMHSNQSSLSLFILELTPLRRKKIVQILEVAPGAYISNLEGDAGRLFEGGALSRGALI